MSLPIDEFAAMGIEEQNERIVGWVGDLNDVFMGRSRGSNPRAVRWWTDELQIERRVVRRRFQRARANGDADVGRHSIAYREKLRQYKDKIVKVEEAEWRRFVEENRDDPLGASL